MYKTNNYYHLFSVILSFTISSTLAQIHNETDDLETFKCSNPVTQNHGSIQLTYYLTESQNFYECLIELTSSTHFRICICSSRTCIKQQCKRGEVFDVTHNECQDAETAFLEANNYNDERPLPEDFRTDSPMYYGLHCRQCPINMFLVFPDYPNVVFSIKENNVMKTTPSLLPSPDHDSRITYELITSCFGGIPEGRFLIPSQEIITVCKTPIDIGNKTDQQSTETASYETVKLISIPFLLVVVLAHTCIPKLRKLHGINSTCYVGALFIAYTFAGIEVVIGDSPTGPTFCFIRGIAAVFLYLPAYFWLSIMCIEIWWKFSEFQIPWRFKGTPRIQAIQKHTIWQAIGWGGPILLIWSYHALNIFPLITSYVIKPDLRKEKCFININTDIVDVTIPKNQIILWVLFFAPEGFLIFLNIILLLRVGIKICATRRGNQMVNEEENQINYEGNKQRFFLYLELFIIITVHLVILFINTVRQDPTPPWLQNSVEISFGLIGVYIFLVYSFRPRFLKLIKFSLCPPRAMENEERKKNANTNANRPKVKSTEMELLYIEGCSKTGDKSCDNENENLPYY